MFFQTDSAKLFYETAGYGQPLLLLHGNGEDSRIFDKIIEPLSQKYQVFALDSRDHGRSEATGALSYENMARDVLSFCKGLNLSDVTLYGFSDGGIVALLAASQEPALFSRLVVSGANIRPDGLQFWFRAACRVGYFFSRKPRVKMMLEEPNITAGQLKKITACTLVLAGERDIIRKQHTLEIAAAIPGSELILIKGENHASYVIHSRKLLNYL